MGRNKEIVFVNQNAGYLMIDIINAHAPYYAQISFITGKIVQRQTPLDSKVKVEKIISYNRSSTLKRLFTWFWAFVQIGWLLKTRYRKAEVFLVSNPPFTNFLPLFCKNKFRFLIYDIYPDALVEYKIFTNEAWLIKRWKAVNLSVFNKTEKIYTLSAGMKKALSLYSDEQKITVVPIWTDNDFLQPIAKTDNLFIQKYSLENKFLIVYSGNLGYSHPLEILLDVAKMVDYPDILFVIIGDGDKKALLEKRIEQERIHNCLMLPWQEVSMLPHSLSASNIAVVSLGKEASLLSVPSKTFNLMSVGAPLLCIADKQSELAVLLSKYQNGQCFEETEVLEMKNYILKLYTDISYHNLLTNNSLKASVDFGPENAKKFLPDIFTIQ